MAAVAQVRKAEAGHPDQPVDVGLEDHALVVLGGVVEQVAPEGEAGAVDEDVQAALERRHRLGDEPLAARRVGDVQLQPMSASIRSARREPPTTRTPSLRSAATIARRSHSRRR